MINIDGVLLTDEKIIKTPKGDIFHAMKNSSDGYKSFGEAYFSFTGQGEVKAWKKHNDMTLNLVVPVGELKFVLYDSRMESDSRGAIDEFVIGPDNYKRLTVPPGIWCGFQGVGKVNMLLNIADMLHDPDEAERMDIDNDLFVYQW